ncbi:MAG: hypothetical protein AB7G75_36090 [Candidatus Binatia bacterium]
MEQWTKNHMQALLPETPWYIALAVTAHLHGMEESYLERCLPKGRKGMSTEMLHGLHESAANLFPVRQRIETSLRNLRKRV